MSSSVVNSFLDFLGVKPQKSLEHYGVKGQRWGVRRSPAQLDRAAARRSGPPEKTDTKNERVETVRTRYKTGPKRLTQTELKERIARMEMEKRYNELNARTVSEGEVFIKTVLKDAGRQVATKTLAGLGTHVVKKGLSAKLGEEAVKEMFKKK